MFMGLLLVKTVAWAWAIRGSVDPFLSPHCHPHPFLSQQYNFGSILV